MFLHPETHEEYALARTERKHGRGYRGFEFFASPDVTLEEDLARRDLTINAMARDDDGALIDPFGGAADLARGRAAPRVAGVRRGSAARAARRALRRALRFRRRAGDRGADARARARPASSRRSPPERVWQELARGLMEPHPSRMLAVLRDCGALARVLPEVDALYGVPQPRATHPEIDAGVHVALALDYAAAQGFALAARYAVLAHDLGKAATPTRRWPAHHGARARSVRLADALSARLKVPVECRDAARLAARWHGTVHRAAELRPATLLDLLRRPTRCAGPSASSAARCVRGRRCRDPGRRATLSAGGDASARALATVRGVRRRRGRARGARRSGSGDAIRDGDARGAARGAARMAARSAGGRRATGRRPS